MEEKVKCVICGKEIRKNESIVDILYYLKENYYCSKECAKRYLDTK